MTIAEALIERKRIQQMMEQTKERVMNQTKIYEGDMTLDDIGSLIEEIIGAREVFEDLTRKINRSNQIFIVRDNISISDLIAKKDALQFTKNKLQQIYKSAAEKVDRYGRSSEIKIITPVDLVELRAQIDRMSTEINELNVELQKCNWNFELID